MIMKHHIHTALREQMDQWEALLSRLSEEQINAPLEPSPWSIKDVIAHMMAWQKRSVARMQAAALNREPEFHLWPTEIDPDADVNRANDWVFQTYRHQPWARIHEDWKEGFERLLSTIEPIPEPLLLGTDIYLWLKPYPLAVILLSSYDHHQEHYEKCVAWLKEHGGM